MWPFRKKQKSPKAPEKSEGQEYHEFRQWVPSPVLPSGWVPRYYSTAPGIELFTQDIPPVLSWPDMDADTCGHRAAESLMGLFSQSDPTCDVHLWCGLGDRMVIAECYQAQHPDDSRSYIGAYLWPVRGLEQDNSVTYGPMATGKYETGYEITAPPKPVSKALMWALSGGDVVIRRGTIQPADVGISQWDQGIIDPATAEDIRCASREVAIFLPTPPQYQDKPPAFLAVRQGDAWYLSRCWQLGSRESGGTVWQATPSMFYLDALYQPHNDVEWPTRVGPA